MNRFFFKIKVFMYKVLGKKESLIKLNINYYRSLGVKIGSNMRPFSPLISSEPYLLSFGDNVTVSTNVSFITHDNSVIKILPNYTDTFGEIKVGNNCFIGSGAIILPGVELGQNVIVGAGSVVTKSFTEGHVIIGGNPAKVICSTNDYEKKIQPYALNTKGLSYKEKRKLIHQQKEKFIKK